MSDVGDVLVEALKLPREERAALAGQLISSLEDADPAYEVERAWSEEIARRVGELKAGRAQLVPWEEARERIAARLKPRA